MTEEVNVQDKNREKMQTVYDPKNKNLFCKKYANCRGKSKKAKANRRKLEIQKLFWAKKRSTSKMMTAKLEREIEKLLRVKKLEDVTDAEITAIKTKVKEEVLNANKTKTSVES